MRSNRKAKPKHLVGRYMKTLFFFLLIQSGHCEFPENFTSEIPDAKVLISMNSSENNDDDVYRKLSSRSIDQGQVLSDVSKKYLKWSLEFYNPVKLEDDVLKALKKVSPPNTSLIGFIAIYPKNKNYAYFIKKTSHFDMIEISKISLLPNGLSEEGKEVEFGKYYWSNAERILLAIGERQYFDRNGKEAFDKIRENVWSKFESQETQGSGQTIPTK